MRKEKRVILENGDVLIRAKDGIFLRATQLKNGLSMFQMVNDVTLEEEVKAMFHVEHSGGKRR